MSVGCGVIRRLNFLGDNFWVIGVYLYMGLGEIGYMFMDGGYEKSLFDLFLFADEKSDFMELVGVGQKDWGINPARPQNSEADGELLGWVDRMGGN